MIIVNSHGKLVNHKIRHLRFTLQVHYVVRNIFIFNPVSYIPCITVSRSRSREHRNIM